MTDDEVAAPSRTAVCHVLGGCSRAAAQPCNSVAVATLATRPSDDNVTAFIDAVADERRRADAHALLALFERVTGQPATMWGASIVGFGIAPYTNSTGTHEWFVVGFSPRKQALTIYGIHDGYAAPDPLLESLGPHTTGKGCVYLKRLDHADPEVLEQLVRNAWQSSTDGS